MSTPQNYLTEYLSTGPKSLFSLLALTAERLGMSPNSGDDRIKHFQEQEGQCLLELTRLSLLTPKGLLKLAKRELDKEKKQIAKELKQKVASLRRSETLLGPALIKVMRWEPINGDSIDLKEHIISHLKGQDVYSDVEGRLDSLRCAVLTEEGWIENKIGYLQEKLARSAHNLRVLKETKARREKWLSDLERSLEGI
jgi:hypothetical protein